MISACNVDEFIAEFPEELITRFAKRKFVTYHSFRIYLHPTEPRFGASLNGKLYSFRRPRGARGTKNREAGVDFSRPRILNGYFDHRGKCMITITSNNKIEKGVMMCEIFQDKSGPFDSVVYKDGDRLNFSFDNLCWSSTL